jgi:hypothetical protein
VSIDVFSAPDPLVRGPATLKLVATDTIDHAPTSGFTMTMVPFMPAMGHGSATEPIIVEQGGGVYLADDVIMAMPGAWQLRTTIERASGPSTCADSILFDVDVQ